MTTCTHANTTPFPWEKWAQRHKEEREAEMKEAAKQAAKEDDDDTTCVQPDQADQVSGGTIGNSDSATLLPSLIGILQNQPQKLKHLVIR